MMHDDDMRALSVLRKTGAERFHAAGTELPFDLLDFWRWYCSDITSNVTRGVIAEYIVAQALGVMGGVRMEWDAFDLTTRDGVRVEVKSAAYLQSWHQTKHSAISFSIQPTIGWNASTNEYGSERKRQADIYVFALLAHRDKHTLDPLDVVQWEFFVVPTRLLDARFPTQARIALSTLLALQPARATFETLTPAVARAYTRVEQGG